MDAVERLSADLLSRYRDTIDLRQREGFEATRQIVLTGKGKEIMDELRSVLADMDDAERALLKPGMLVCRRRHITPWR